MKKFHFPPLLFVLLIMISVACRDAKESELVDQTRIWTSYELSYDAATNITTAKASFRHFTSVGRRLKLTNGSTVRFQNQILPEKTELLTNITYYERQFTGHIENGIFSWTDGDGRVYNNEITNRMIDFPQFIEDIFVNEPFEFYWDGLELQHNEVAKLRIVSGATKNFTQNNAMSESFMLLASDLQQLSPGIGMCTLERTHTPPLIEKTFAGGKIEASFKPVPREVNLLE
jgi:hypothetical protein